ncbi:MAG: OadG family protein [Clostridia bacterium]|nr:OadG family protein [Clostridia bacterium]
MGPIYSGMIPIFCMNNVEGEPELWLVVAAGISVVFIGMIMLTVILYLMSALGKIKKKAPKAAVVDAKELTEENGETVETVDGEDDDELRAVIAAAIAAYNADKRSRSSIRPTTVKRLGRRASRNVESR